MAASCLPEHEKNQKKGMLFTNIEAFIVKIFRLDVYSNTLLKS